MKKNLQSCFFICISSLFFLSCGNKKEQAQDVSDLTGYPVHIPFEQLSVRNGILNSVK